MHFSPYPTFFTILHPHKLPLETETLQHCCSCFFSGLKQTASEDWQEFGLNENAVPSNGILCYLAKQVSKLTS